MLASMDCSAQARARSLCRTAQLSIAVAFSAALFATAATAEPQTAAASSGLTPDQKLIVSKTAKPGRGAEVQYNGTPIEAIGGRITLPLGSAKRVTLRRKDSELQKDGSLIWQGEVEETGERALLMLWSSALLTGYFAYNGTIYTLENLGGGVAAVAEQDPSKLPPDHPAAAAPRDSVQALDADEPPPKTLPPEPAVGAFPDSERAALEARNFVIDVMLLYSNRVAERYVRDPTDLLALAIEETNDSFRNSGLGNIRLRLVHTQVVDYDGQGDDNFNHLYTMVDGLGPFKDVKRLRNEKRADIVGLIIDNPAGCGLSTRVGPSSDEAYFVVHHSCAMITLSIAHEIGHILGVRHDRFVDDNDTPFAYGHGFVNGNKWRDIMSYKAGCGGCPRIPYWSSPRIVYKGMPTGTNASDSARVILELAEQVSKFR
jgi:hypothetical protein